MPLHHVEQLRRPFAAAPGVPSGAEGNLAAIYYTWLRPPLNLDAIYYISLGGAQPSVINSIQVKGGGAPSVVNSS